MSYRDEIRKRGFNFLTSTSNEYIKTVLLIDIIREKIKSINGRELEEEYHLSEKYPKIYNIKVKDMFIQNENMINTILEQCICNFVLYFNTLLDDIFLILIKQYIEDGNEDIKISNRSVKLKLSSFHNFKLDEITETYLKDYQFDNFKDRIRYFKDCISEDTLNQLIKMVVIRNCIQHHNSILQEESLKQIGRNNIQVLNEDKKLIVLGINDRIKLSIEELEEMRVVCIDYVRGVFKKFDIK